MGIDVVNSTESIASLGSASLNVIWWKAQPPVLHGSRKRPKMTVLTRKSVGLVDWRAWEVEIPGQELLDAVDGVIGKASQDGAKVRLGIEAIQFGGAQ
jgi:hypothetical protein